MVQSSINPQYVQGQNQCANYAFSPAPVNTVGGSASAVNIQIFGPTANPPAQGFYQNTPCAPYPYNYNNMIQRQAPVAYENAQTAVMPRPSEYGSVGAMPETYDTLNKQKAGSGVAGSAKAEKETQAEKTGNQEPALTDDYIKELESRLSAQDDKIRLSGAKELLDTFKASESRKNDPALTALLNKTLQDPKDTVKFMALATLDAGYAKGDEKTIDILKNLQNSDSNYGEDAKLATKILYKIEGVQSENAAASEQKDNVKTATKDKK